VEYLLILGLALAALYAWGIGSNDMANIIATPIGGGAIKKKYAILIYIIFLVLGALLQGYMVIKTLGKGVVRQLDLTGAVAASLAAITWVYLASLLGLPISTTLSATSGVIGVGLAYVFKNNDWSYLNLGVINNIIISWISSPILSMITAMWMYILLKKFFSTRSRRIIEVLTALAVAWDAYSFGANDVANATGVYMAVIGGTTLARSILGLGVSESLFLALYGAIFMALGGVVMGWRVIDTVGYKITKLDPVGGLTEALSSALIAWLFTTIPYMLIGYGMPISTTYASVGAVFGIGIVRSRSLRRGLNVKVTLLIILSWILTLPIAAILGTIYYFTLCYIMR
jgi:PiT family inorganic phosphate transporter